MAGGSGTRFWPASRARLPKQFLKIAGDHTLFEDTLNRVAPVASPDRIYAVVNRLHEELTQELLAGTGAHILAEPVGRNTAPCIGLAALHIARIDRKAPIIVLPADHFIADVVGFRRTLAAATEVAREGAIVTLGAVPTRPETGYGYIEVGEQRGEAEGEPYFEAARFVEKPDRQTALRYLSSGHHLWNSGVFIFTAETILREIGLCLPGLSAGLQEVGEAIATPEYGGKLEAVYEKTEAISIDYGVLEKTAAPIYVLRADFGWSDVGSWEAVYDLHSDRLDDQQNLLISEAMAIDARQNLVYSTTDRVVALLGVENLVVVDTPDALLVADRSRSQDVKQFPETLKRTGQTART